MQEPERAMDIDVNAIRETAIRCDISDTSIAFVGNQGAITAQGINASGEAGDNAAKNKVYGAASLSKVVFAYLVLKLIQNDILTFDEDLDKILSFGSFCKQNDFGYYPALENIKLDIKSILSHTTGLGTFKNEEIIKHQSEPGNYWYSGIPLLYLQKVIEAKTGLSLEELAKKYIFGKEACDMPHSTFYREYDLAEIPDNMDVKLQPQTLYIKPTTEGLSYRVIDLDGQIKDNIIPWNNLPKNFPRNTDEIIQSKKTFLPDILRFACASGHTTKENAHSANSLFTTAEDYANFLKKWMNDESDLMKSAFIEIVDMRKDDWAKGVGVPANDLKNIGWGCGWGLEFTDNSDAPRKAAKAYHTGDMNNWRAFVAIDIDQKIAIVYFANSPNGLILADKIITPNIKLEYVFKYFSRKYGFALEENDWQNVQKKQFEAIGQWEAKRTQWKAEQTDDKWRDLKTEHTEKSEEERPTSTPSFPPPKK